MISLFLSKSNALAFNYGSYKHSRNQAVEIDSKQLAKCMVGALKTAAKNKSHGLRKLSLERKNLLCTTIHNPDEPNGKGEMQIIGNEEDRAEKKKHSKNSCNISAYDKNDRFEKQECTDEEASDFGNDYLGAQGDKSGGRTRTEYCSGHEMDLEKWILSQKDNSVNPVNLMLKATELNDGNIFLAALTVHQLLRNYARGDLKYRYYLYVPAQRRDAFFNKLIDLRGDLKERDPKQYTGDHRGTWYRIFGVMLARMNHTAEEPDFSVCRTGSLTGIGKIAEDLMDLSMKTALYLEINEKAGKGPQGRLKKEEDQGKGAVDQEALSTTNEMLYLLRYSKQSSEDAGCKAKLPNYLRAKN